MKREKVVGEGTTNRAVLCSLTDVCTDRQIAQEQSQSQQHATAHQIAAHNPQHSGRLHDIGEH